MATDARVTEADHAAMVRMSRTIVETLANLRSEMASSEKIRQMWRDDPVACMDLVIDTVRRRHVEGVRDL